MPPTVSVVICAHNGLRYLPQALRSVYRQTFRDFEVVVVDDASTDGTLEYLERARRRGLRLLALPRNVGLSKAHNASLPLCRGRFLAMIDQDDVWSPRFLETLLAAPGARRAKVLWCDYGLIDDEGRPLAARALGVEFAAHPRFVRVTGRPTLPLPSASLVSRRAVLAVGGFDEGYARGGEDADLFCRLGRRYGPGAFVFVDRALARRRRHAAQRTAKPARSRWRRLSGLAVERALDMLAFHHKHGDWLR